MEIARSYRVRKRKLYAASVKEKIEKKSANFNEIVNLQQNARDLI